jgi:hypothetical protein
MLQFAKMLLPFPPMHGREGSVKPPSWRQLNNISFALGRRVVRRSERGLSLFRMGFPSQEGPAKAPTVTASSCSMPHLTYHVTTITSHLWAGPLMHCEWEQSRGWDAPTMQA